MYYGKQNSSNIDYYNSYKGNSYKYKGGTDYLKLILKILIILLLICILFIGFLFISNKAKIVENRVERVDKLGLFSISEEEPSVKKEEFSKKIIKEMTLIKDNKVHLTQGDISNIVSIVMKKMDVCKKNSIISDNDYTKELLSQDVDKLNNPKTVIVNRVNTNKIVKDSIKLSNTDHYNKIVINRPKRLSKLSIELNSIISEDNTILQVIILKKLAKRLLFVLMKCVLLW